MRPLKLAVIGHVNYHDELNLSNIINSHIKSVYNHNIFNSVEIHFRTSNDDTNKIGRFCDIHGYSYVGYKPNWLDLERRPGVLVKVKNKTGYQYNSLAAVNMNRDLIISVDYVIILKDENSLHNNTSDADVSIFKHLIATNKAIIPTDRTTTIYFNSGVMKHTKFNPKVYGFLNKINSKGSEIIPFPEDLLNNSNRDWFIVDQNTSFYLYNSHWDEKIITTTNTAFKKEVSRILREVTHKKEINFSPTFSILDSTDNRLGVHHLFKFECIMAGSINTNIVKKLRVTFYMDVITFIRVLLHIQFINVEFNKGNHSPKSFHWTNHLGYELGIIIEVLENNSTAILFTANINGVYYKQAYNHHKSLIKDPRGRIIWVSGQILETIQNWQSQILKQNTCTT